MPKGEKDLPYLASKLFQTGENVLEWSIKSKVEQGEGKQNPTDTATANSVVSIQQICNMSIQFPYKHDLARHIQTTHFLYWSHDFFLKRCMHQYGVSLLYAWHSADAPVLFVPSLLNSVVFIQKEHHLWRFI